MEIMLKLAKFMKYGLIADIHSNLEALKTVIRELKVEKIICLGDLVGYGPDPNECINRVKALNGPVIAGNHDKAATGEMEITWFNRDAQDAILWTKDMLTEENLEYLKKLSPAADFEDFSIVHGSLREPLEEYITSLYEALPTFERMVKPLLFIGHSHVPLCIVQKKEGDFDGWMLEDNQKISVSEYQKVIINPGGVGQPRDGDPRASYGIYDLETRIFQLHRIPYDFKTTQEKMRKVNLPPFLIERLAYGR